MSFLAPSLPVNAAFNQVGADVSSAVTHIFADTVNKSLSISIIISSIIIA